MVIVKPPSGKDFKIELDTSLLKYKQKFIKYKQKFINHMKKHPEDYEKYRRMQREFIKEAFNTPTFYCGGSSYNSINEIPFDEDVENYLNKVKNMKFSDGNKLNISNPLFYAKLCYAFECHLENIDNAYLMCEGVNMKTDMPFKCKMELEYRTSERYKKRNIARTYALLDEIKKLEPEDRKVTLVTYTSYQKDEDGRGIDYIMQFQRLIRYMQRLHEVIRKDYPKVPYVHVIESHKSGYIHVHRVYGCEIDREHQEKYRKLWEGYGIGSYENGLDFAYNEYDDYEKKDKDKEYEHYESAFLYQIKYISKSISEKGSVPFHQFLSDAIIWYCSKRTITKYKGIRSFYISPKWNELIKDRFAKPQPVVEWESIILHYCGKEIEIYNSERSLAEAEIMDELNDLIDFANPPPEISVAC